VIQHPRRVTSEWAWTWPSLAELAERQSDVVNRAQLDGCGTGRHAIDRHVKARRWQLVGPRVVVLHSGPLTRLQRRWVGVLHAGDSACLAGLTAAEAGSLAGWERDATHVLVPKGARVPRLDGVVVHESRRFDVSDIHPARLPPQTRMSRSLVDAATWPPRPGPACGLLAAGIQQRLARTADLRAALDQAGQIRHVRLLRCALADVEGGSHSLAEINLVRLCRRHRLRPPDEQQFRHDQEGRRRYLDATWLLRDGRRLVLEVDGGLHLRIDAWWSDMARERDVVIRVGQVLRCSSVEIRVRPDAVARDLARAGVPRAS
jgi:very-short-patch-repair endonuclease